MTIQIKNSALISIFLFLSLQACLSDTESPNYMPLPQPLNNQVNTNTQKNPQPRISPTPAPIIAEKEPEQKEIDIANKELSETKDTDTLSTDTEVIETNINWKEYNPVIKGKKYTYVYTIKEAESEIKTDILREITDVGSSAYKVKQTIISSGESSKLVSTNLVFPLNSDNSPTIIPVASVGGDKVSPLSEINISDKPEKINLPYKALEAIKVSSKVSGQSSTNWYAKNIGLVKAVQVSAGASYILELKKFE